MTTIALPKSLNRQGAVEFVRELGKTPEDNEYMFDFGPLSWAEPLGLLYAGGAIRRFLIERLNRATFRYSNVGLNDCHGYCAHVGFFRAFFIKYGNEPGAASGSTTYLPITKVVVADLKAEAHDRGEALSDAVHARGVALARVLAQGRSRELEGALAFSFREIIRNAAEHSDSELLWYCGQYWPTRRIATIAILDEGIGLRESLSANPYLNVEDDKDAIRFALLPGISGKFFPKSRLNRWGNAGYGLFMTSQLARRGGSFVMLSGQQGVSFGSGSLKQYFDSDLNGTALSLTLSLDSLGNFDEKLKEITSRGERLEKRIARQVEGEMFLSGEAASKLWRSPD